MLKKAFLQVLFLFVVAQSFVQAGEYDFHIFRNYVLGSKNSAANCFAQDSLGMMWIGSNNGLYNFDGYTAIRPLPKGEKYRTFIHSLVTLDDTYLAVGTGLGLWFYNYRQDSYEEVPELKNVDVRALLLKGKQLWIGTLAGLYIYDFEKKELLSLGRELNKKLGNTTIYALNIIKDRVLVGTYDGLFQIQIKENQVSKIALPDYKRQANQFVNSLFVMNDKVWIGTENGLYEYDKANVSKAAWSENIPIKTIVGYSQTQLLIGTDNGLFVLNPTTKSIEKIKHDSRNQLSLANNIIWRMFVDPQQNVWIGTDAGFSIWSPRHQEKSYPIYVFTNRNDGNKFYEIYKDSKDWYWLGGDNGLIRTKSLNQNGNNTFWFSIGNNSFSLPHNRIREIYEDKDGLIWIASDGGINLYDVKSNIFKNYEITDSTQRRNAKWAYDILEDNAGNLWIASYLGGVFVVNKDKLLVSSGKYKAELNYTKSNGLLADFANELLEDKQKRIWILSYYVGVSVLNPQTNKIFEIKDEKGHSLSKASYFIQDSADNVWVGMDGAVLKIGADNKVRRVVFDPLAQSQVTSLAEVGETIWVGTDESIWQINKNDLSVKIIKSKVSVNSIYYDRGQQQILFGEADGILSLNVDDIKKPQFYNDPILLTSVYVDNQIYGSYDYGLRYRNKFVFDSDQNNLRFEFSDLDFENEFGTRFAYRFKEGNDQWIPLDVGDNKLSLANLSSGDYVLQVAKINMQGEVVSNVYEFDITIKYPWYANFWARLVYTILVIGIIFWVINFFRVRNGLRIERLERKNIQEVTKLKMDFFTSISHDLKTPLSLIIGPLSQIILKTRNLDKRKELSNIQKNALKINSLINEVADFDKLNAKDTAAFNTILSTVELIFLTNQIIERFEISDLDKRLSIDLESFASSVYLETDITKLESILMNLISNSIKYNREDKISVVVVIEKSAKGIIIRIKDNGIGISNEEIPYVFNKFYRSTNSENEEVEGTGIGLYIVKSYCEQLGWKLKVDSTLGKGTVFSFYIPENNIIQNVIFEPEDQISIQEKKKVLIVEDNDELASFIARSLITDFDCKKRINGKEALELLESGYVPDLIISDLTMPVLSGLDMTKALKRTKPLSTIPIILLTAQNDRKVERDSASLGIDFFMSKPFDVEFLKVKINQLINRQTQLVEQIKLENIQEPKVEKLKSVDEKLLAKITAIIEDHVDDSEFNVQRLCEEMDIPTKQLYRKIKQIVGQTPVEYIRTVRLKKASALLKQGTFSIAEVMYMVGFTNASYFSKCFQTEFGVTPKAYLEMA